MTLDVWCASHHIVCQSSSYSIRLMCMTAVYHLVAGIVSGKLSSSDGGLEGKYAMQQYASCLDITRE